MEIFRLFGSVFIKDDASKTLDNIEKKGESSLNKLSGTFKKVGAVIAGAFAVNKIVDFGKSMVETTAKVQALNSQFEQTFKNDQSKAMELITKQAQDQGIHVDRLRGAWSSFYGTFRGNGADANQSLELTNKYMQLAADGAAYYDTSLEDVTSRLKSLVMGNFEAGDAIGININATKMDIKAKQEYNKSWKDLTDTQKEYLLIDTVGKIYENNGALGQGAREANNLENVMGNLKATWANFLSIVGSPVLSGVIVVIQGIIDGIMGLTTFIQENSVIFTTIGIAIGTLTTAIIAYNIAQNASAIATAISTMATTAWGSAVAFATSPVTLIVLAIGAFVGALYLLYQNSETVRNAINELGDKFKVIFPLIKELAGAAINFIIARFKDFITFISSILMPFINGIESFVKDNLETIKAIISGVLNSITGVLNVFIGLFTGNWKRAWDGVKQITSGALGVVKNTISLGLNAIKSIWDKVTDILFYPVRVAWDKITGIIDKIKDGFSNIFPVDIKLPHFNISGSLNPIDWIKDGVPKLGVEWYAEGGILTKPTVFGINGATGKAMVGGENGAEAVLPIAKLETFIYNAFMEAINDSGMGNIQILMSNREVGRAVASVVSEELARKKY
ncbi:MAG: hypothetical protein AB2417_01565 [Clostridiaceae bacterium]